MKTITAWAICDTDGGRREPRPLTRHVYASHTEAEQVRKYDGWDREYYPIKMVEIKLIKEEKQ